MAIWYIFALGAAICWGVNYAVTEKILQNGVSFFFLMLVSSLMSLAFALSAVFVTQNEVIKHSMSVIKSGTAPFWMVAAYIISGFAGWICINTAIMARNATAASMIEISYPFFTILLTWLFFRESHLNPAVIFGGILIFGGAVLIVWKG